jgi:hypothetical protein
MKLWGFSGPFTVVHVQNLRDAVTGEALLGRHEWSPRTLTLTTGMHPVSERNVLWHEWIHAMLADAGVELEKAAAEAVCNALAAALTGARVKLPTV